jgi:hypothetical protein
MFGDLGSELPHGCDTFGIVVASDEVSVKSNKISGPECGIDLGCHVGTVSGNTINRSILGLIDVSSAFSGSNTLHGRKYFVEGVAREVPQGAWDD